MIKIENSSNPAVTALRGQGSNLEAVVGDTLTFTVDPPLGLVSVVLTSKPGGSSATVSSGAFTVDLVGTYVVTVARAFTVDGDGTQSTTAAEQVTVRAFPASALTIDALAKKGTSAIFTTRPDADRRLILRAIAVDAAQHGTFDWTTLSTASPLPSWASVQSYGGG